MYKGGLFSPPVVVAVGDPYIDPYKTAGRPHGMTKGVRQFGIGKGIEKGPYPRLFEGEQYKSTSKVSAEDRMKDRAGFRTPNGFVYASPLKKSASVGDYYGTFTPKGYQHMPDGLHDRTAKSPFKKFAQRNVYTSPPKKTTGVGGFQNTTPKILLSSFEYVESPYDAAHQKEKVYSYLIIFHFLFIMIY
jgi:hypothetical protein